MDGWARLRLLEVLQPLPFRARTADGFIGIDVLIQHKPTGLSCRVVAAFPYLVRDTDWTLAVRRESCVYGAPQFSHSILPASLLQRLGLCTY